MIHSRGAERHSSGQYNTHPEQTSQINLPVQYPDISKFIHLKVHMAYVLRRNCQKNL